MTSSVWGDLIPFPTSQDSICVKKLSTPAETGLLFTKSNAATERASQKKPDSTA